MREIPAAMQEAWVSGDFTGPRKPAVRITVTRPKMALHQFTFPYPKVPVDVPDVDGIPVTAPVRPKSFTQTYADFLFHGDMTPVELPNVKSVAWSRSVDTDIASGTATFINGAPQPLGSVIERGLDQAGLFTYNRGQEWFSNRWEHSPNRWSRLLMPDNILRVYEGYGADPGVMAEEDPHLVQTGTWLIDEVSYRTDGLIEVTFRDLGRVLTDQMVFHPVVPEAFYPLRFAMWPVPAPAPGKPVPIAPVRVPLVYDNSSAFPYWDGGTSGNHLIHGHRAQDAFDDDPASFWLSVGNSSPTHTFSYEWVQGRMGGQSLAQVRFATYGKGYTVYLSVHDGTRWVTHGSKDVIPYLRGGIAEQNTAIGFCERAAVGSEAEQTITLRKPIPNARLVRLTFHNLTKTPFGSGSGSPSDPHVWGRYRVGVRTMRAYVSATKPGPPVTAKTPTPPGAGANPGYYFDFTDVVKLACAWGGFHQPMDGGFKRSGDPVGVEATMTPNESDWVLGPGETGRVFGWFDPALTLGEKSPLGVELFDKKSLLDMIVYVANITGFLFYIDEIGSVVWRRPNIWEPGNVTWTVEAGDIKPQRTTDVVLIDENTTLLDLRASLSSRSTRERVFVANTDGKAGAVVAGFNPNPVGLRRVGGWTDQNFDDSGGSTAAQKCVVMADLIAIRQLFTYRTDRVTIPGFPRIQVDDQVRIYERVSSEGYLHYVRSVSSSMDLETGVWTYDLDVSWLGEDPSGVWTLRTADLAPETQRYLAALAQVREF